MKYEIKDIDLNKNKNIFVAMNKKYISASEDKTEYYYMKNRNIFYTGKQIYFSNEKKVVITDVRIHIELMKLMKECQMDIFLNFVEQLEFNHEEVDEKFIRSCFIDFKFFFVKKKLFINELWIFDYINLETRKGVTKDIVDFNKYHCMNFYADEERICDIILAGKEIKELYLLEDVVYSYNSYCSIVDFMNESNLVSSEVFDTIRNISEEVNKKTNNKCSFIKLKDNYYLLENYKNIIYKTKNDLKPNLNKDVIFNDKISGYNLIDFMIDKEGKYIFIFKPDYSYNELTIYKLKPNFEEIKDSFNISFSMFELIFNDELINKICLEDLPYFEVEKYKKEVDVSEIEFTGINFRNNLLDNFKIYGTEDNLVKCYWTVHYKENIFVEYKNKMYCITCNSVFSPLYQLENTAKYIEENFEAFVEEHNSAVMFHTLGV